LMLTSFYIWFPLCFQFDIAVLLCSTFGIGANIVDSYDACSYSLPLAIYSNHSKCSCSAI
jgi:hypothetical protein